MDLAGLIPTEAIIGDQDGGHAETNKAIVLDDCFTPGSDEKAPGFGAGYIAMADVDPGCPGDILHYICEPDFLGNRPGKGDENFFWGYPSGGFDYTILIYSEGVWLNESDRVAGVIGHKAVGLRMHEAQD